MQNIHFTGGTNIALKIPLHKYGETVRFYKEVLKLEVHEEKISNQFGYQQMIETFRVAGVDISDPIEKIQRGLGALVKTVDTDEVISHGMAFLQLNVSDPDFNAIAQKGMQTLRDTIEQHLKTAAQNNHLPKNVNTLRLASSILTIYNGTLITWALLREGKLADVLRANMEEVLS